MPLKVSSVVWKLFLDCLPTRDNLVHMNVLQASECLCSGCQICPESATRVFLNEVISQCSAWIVPVGLESLLLFTTTFSAIHGPFRW